MPLLTALAQVASSDKTTMVAVIKALIAGDYMIEFDNNSAIAERLRTLVQQLQHSGSQDLDRLVSLSLCANETSIASARLLYNLQTADGEAHNIASAAEQLEASIRQIRDHSESVRQGNEAAAKTVDQVSQSLAVSISAFEKIRASVQENSSQIEHMSGFATEIRNIAGAIKDVAAQTNLLALNASVEAARAGAVGAGFAVVAQEMQVLANNSTSATKLITDLVDDFERRVKDIGKTLDSSVDNVDQGKVAINRVDEQMTLMRRDIENSTACVSQISHAIDEQGLASSCVTAGINQVARNTSDSVDATGNILDAMNELQELINLKISDVAELNLPHKVIKLAQSDHVIWKKRLVNMICGKEGLNEQELADHHSCRLGKWYDQIQDPLITQKPAFKDLASPHEKVHRHGKQAVAFYNDGKIDQALAEIQQVEESSEEVLDLLRQLAQ